MANADTRENRFTSENKTETIIATKKRKKIIMPAHGGRKPVYVG